MAMPFSSDPLKEARKAVSHFTDRNTEAQDDKCESFKVAWEAVKEQNLCLPAPKPFLLSALLCVSVCLDRIGSIGWGFKPSTGLFSEFLTPLTWLWTLLSLLLNCSRPSISVSADGIAVPA